MFGCTGAVGTLHPQPRLHSRPNQQPLHPAPQPRCDSSEAPGRDAEEPGWTHTHSSGGGAVSSGVGGAVHGGPGEGRLLHYVPSLAGSEVQSEASLRVLLPDSQGDVATASTPPVHAARAGHAGVDGCGGRTLPAHAPRAGLPDRISSDSLPSVSAEGLRCRFSPINECTEQASGQWAAGRYSHHVHYMSHHEWPLA